jgi:PAS domain S-box-containing protein
VPATPRILYSIGKVTVETTGGDDRVEQILRFIEQTARGRTAPAPAPSSRGDALDALVAGLARLADDLRASTVSRQYVESILRSMPDALVVFGPDGRIATVNRATCELLGYSAEELVGQPLGALMAADPDAVPPERLVTVHTKRDVPIALRARDGAVIPMQANLSIHRGADQKVLGVVVVARDVRTTRALVQDLEARLRELRDTQEQLLQAGKMAAVGTLLAGLSHDLNNPVTVILGYAQRLVKDLPDDHPSHGAAVVIERQAARCAALIDTLLGFSRREGAERRRVAAAAMAERVALLAGPQAKRRTIRLDVVAPAGALLEVEVSETELEAALLNLVNNALDASPVGGVVVIRAEAVERDGQAGVALCVADGGDGIADDVLPHIFDAFFTTKPPGQGTGLGLSLARHVATAHGGDIDVETAAGGGTTMRLWLPAAT